MLVPSASLGYCFWGEFLSMNFLWNFSRDLFIKWDFWGYHVWGELLLLNFPNKSILKFQKKLRHPGITFEGKVCHWISFKLHSGLIELIHFKKSPAKFGKDLLCNFLEKICWWGTIFWWVYFGGRGGGWISRSNKHCQFMFLLIIFIFFRNHQNVVKSCA